jgi:hypothetical protein
MPGLTGAAGEAAATVSRNDASAGKPAGLSPTTYRSPTRQRPTSHPNFQSRGSCSAAGQPLQSSSRGDGRLAPRADPERLARDSDLHEALQGPHPRTSGSHLLEKSWGFSAGGPSQIFFPRRRSPR